MQLNQKVLISGLVLLSPELAMAYVGPGAGIGLVGALGGLALIVLISIGVILILPIRMLLRKKKAREEKEAKDDHSNLEDS
ncbi:MAG: hypothetical protein VYA80_08110 [Pseudomonadota bacterium]|nr:hypothetical protein [Pseudomonadota bacterium]